jgi:hypothetical protein
MDYYNINISDINGAHPSVNTKIILIVGDDLYKTLTKIAANSKTSIWKIDRAKIDKLLLDNGVEPKNFVDVGHIYYNNNKPKEIILAHKTICGVTNKFNKIKDYGKGCVYEPVVDTDYIRISDFWFDKTRGPVHVISKKYKNIIETNKNNYCFLNFRHTDTWSKYVNKTVCLKSNPKPWFGTNINRYISTTPANNNKTQYVIVCIIIIVIIMYVLA